MPRETIVQFYTRRIREQQEWLKSCGETMAGYVDHYGAEGRTVVEAEAIFKADYWHLQKCIAALDDLDKTKGGVTVSQALVDARDMLEALGIKSGDIAAGRLLVN